ncbi:uncharacterized protein LOC144495228 isoform X1 [Mustelus asterias]
MAMAGFSSDQDSPPARRARLTESSHSNFDVDLIKRTLSVRISDHFVQTVGGIICPFAIAGASVCVLKQLHSMALPGVLRDVAEFFGVIFVGMRGGSIVVEFQGNEPLSQLTRQHVLQKIQAELLKLMPAGNFRVERIRNPAKAKSPQEPLVSKVDFARHILKSVRNELEAKVKFLSSGTVDWLDVNNTIGDLNCLIKEFEEKRAKISMLSQNGKGKSSILNFLLCLTADNEMEYRENNKYLKMREELEKMKEDKRTGGFQRMLAVCKCTSTFSNLTMEEALKNEKKSFDSLSNYLETGGLKSLQPYLLPVKNITNIYSTTTKCIVCLKYGSVYQMKIKYFNVEELQTILYELVTMIKGGDNDDGPGVEAQRKKTSREALEKLFCLLTTYFPNHHFNKDLLQNIERSQSIKLCQDVKDLAGTCEYYVGEGKNVMKDRIFIRENLRKYVTMQEIPSAERALQNRKIAALKSIEVYAPCKILIGKELLEAPGVDESDPLALKQINDVLNEVNSVLYISDYSFTTSEKEVKEFLLQSGFLDKCLATQSDQKLFLITYPEKNPSLSLSLDKESTMSEQQLVQRQNDLVALERLWQRSLPDEFKGNLSTPTLYPVSYASILMKAGDPTKVVREHEKMLKLTGMQSFLEEIDHFAFDCAKSSVGDVKDLLCQLENRADQHNQYYGKEELKKILRNKELMELLSISANKDHDSVLKNTSAKLKEAREGLILNIVKPLLEAAAEASMEQWDSNKSQIDSIGIFNPYFNGKHPAYKLKLYDIAYGYLQMPDFKDFLDETRKIMDQYKECAIQNLSDFLAEHFEKDSDKMQSFVRLVTEKELDAAIGWYMGKKRLPFTERKLRKLFKEALVESLKYFLVKIYDMQNIEEMKRKVSKDLKTTTSKVLKNFESKLEYDLHDTRWKSFMGKVKTRGTNSKSRIWQLVTSSLKNELNRKEVENFKSNVEDMIKMVDVALKDTRTTF